METKINNYILGIDVGIASIGSAVVDLENGKIIYAGVRCFDTAENKNLLRRQKRLARRVLRRRKQRLRAVARLLRAAFGHKEMALLEGEEIWNLRVEALERKLSGAELEAVFRHIAKRRGFRSSKRADAQATDPETSKMLKGVSDLEGKLNESGCRSIGEFLSKEEKRRNRPGEYTRTVLRKLLEKEVRLIFEKQRSFGNNVLTEELEQKIQEVMFSQKPLRSTEELVRECTFEPTEYRAPKCAITAELSRLLQRFNHLKIEQFGKSPLLVTDFLKDSLGEDALQEKIEALIQLAKKQKSVTYKALRKELEIPEEYKFSDVLRKESLDKASERRKKFKKGEKESTPAEDEKRKEKDYEGEKFDSLRGWHEVQKALTDADLKDEWQRLSEDYATLDKIAWILTVEKDDKKTGAKLRELRLPDKVVEALLPISFKEHGNLSVVALNKILPFLKKGLTYDKAVVKAGYNLAGAAAGNPRLDRLPKFPEIPNPVVNRSLSQSRKVINAIIDKYGLPNIVNIELARDFGRSAKEREQIENDQKERKDYNDAAANTFKEIFNGREPKGKELAMFKLWREQGGRCAYSLKHIEPLKILEENALQIDHIIPYSRSLDDSWNNKVLVFTEENQNKGNKTPAEYIGVESVKWEDLKEFVKSLRDLPYRKRSLLLKETFTEEEEKGFIKRNLNDTRYIARELKNHIENNLRFLNDGKGHVFVRQGACTSTLRHFWGLGKKDREANDRHHAVDAIILACTTESIVKKILTHKRLKDDGITLGSDRTARMFPLPWDSFRADVEEVEKNVFVSRMTKKKVTGEVHKETIRSARMVTNEDGTEERVVVETVKLQELKLKDLNNLWDKERNSKLYEVLKARLAAFGGNSKEAFKEPVYMPCKSGQGPEIKSVKIKTDKVNGVYVRGQGEKRKGFAYNAKGSMLRIDIFEKEGKFYQIPIYVTDIVKKELPNKYAIREKPEEEWGVIDDTFKFKFSLYPNDLVYILKRGGEELWGYYVTYDRGGCRATIMSPDCSTKRERVYLSNLQAFDKYRVDVLGNYRKVISEERCGLENRCHRKRSKVKLKG